MHHTQTSISGSFSVFVDSSTWMARRGDSLSHLNNCFSASSSIFAILHNSVSSQGNMPSFVRCPRCFEHKLTAPPMLRDGVFLFVFGKSIGHQTRERMQLQLGNTLEIHLIPSVCLVLCVDRHILEDWRKEVRSRENNSKAQNNTFWNIWGGFGGGLPLQVPPQFFNS